MMWEYKVVHLDQFVNENKHLGIAEHLDLFGKEKWELVGIHEPKNQPFSVSNRLSESFMVFKRAMAN